MHSIDSLLGMVATEAAEGSVDGCLDHDHHRQPGYESKPYDPNGLSFRYNLELIRKPDGTLDWVE